MPSAPQDADAPPAAAGLGRICGHLLRRGQQIHAALWVDGFGAELTSPQYAVLAVLAVHPRIDQRRLGELASLDTSSTADVVGRLAGRAWLTRAGDPEDARRNLLVLTPSAAVEMRRLTAAAARVQQRLLQPLPADRVPAFLRRLRVASRLDGALPDADRSPAGAAPVLELDVPGHLIRRAQRMHQAVWFREFGREITGPQYAALFVLAGSPDINQRRLGSLAALDRSTGGGVVDRLVRRGWIVRRRDPSDGRGHVLRLADEIEGGLDLLTRRVQRVQRQLLEPLEPDERERFLDDLAAVALVDPPS